MATTGKPAITIPRTNDQRAIADAVSNIKLRIEAIENALALVAGQTGQTLQSLLQNLINQSDGIVVKTAGALTTRALDVGAGLTVDNPSGVAGNPKVSLDVSGAGLLVYTGSGLVTRVLQSASGSGISITDPDGVANDPAFHT